MKENELNASFNEDFCIHLEYHLCSTFENSNRDELKGFWCDGVSWTPLPENQLDLENLKRTRRIETKAWIGKTGQTEYVMTILFGEKALDNYLKGKNLIDTIPSEETMDWIDLDINKKRIEIQLM